MFDREDQQFEATSAGSAAPADNTQTANAEGSNGTPGPAAETTGNGAHESDVQRWHAAAGRKGAHRVHELIREGKLYEEEHGLKSGRQRLRQLIELGKLYEKEHGILPGPQKQRRERLTGMERKELLGTFLQCLRRIAKPSFRPELTRLVKAMQEQKEKPIV
jgi:hypothetical protein